MLGPLNARAVVLSTGFGAGDIALTKWAHTTIGAGLSNELACALSVRKDALYVLGASHKRGIVESHYRYRYSTSWAEVALLLAANAAGVCLNYV